MNQTLRSMLFWMVLVVVGVLIWNFSTDFQARDTALPFSEFVAQVEQGQVDTVTLTGWCQGDGYRVGFGECSGKLLPAH